MAESRDNTVCSSVVWPPLFSSVPMGRSSCGGHPLPMGRRKSPPVPGAVPSSGRMLCGLRCHEPLPEFSIPVPKGSDSFQLCVPPPSVIPPHPTGYALAAGPPCTILSTLAFLTVYPHCRPYHMHSWFLPYMCVLVPVAVHGCTGAHLALQCV